MPPNRTAYRIVRAKRALADVSAALAGLNAGGTLEEFRMGVVLCLTLLRACGHVLNSEASECAPLRRVNNSFWPGVSRDPIFTEFIQAFRNSVVKEYRVPIRWSMVRQLGHSSPTEHYYVLDGHYRGQDFRDLVREGVSWWDAYLGGLEAELVNQGFLLIDPPEPAPYPDIDDD